MNGNPFGAMVVNTEHMYGTVQVYSNLHLYGTVEVYLTVPLYGTVRQNISRAH